MRIVCNLPLGANLNDSALRALLDAGRTMEQTYSTGHTEALLVLQSCASGNGSSEREYFTATLSCMMASSITPRLVAPLKKREE